MILRCDLSLRVGPADHRVLGCESESLDGHKGQRVARWRSQRATAGLLRLPPKRTEPQTEGLSETVSRDFFSSRSAGDIPVAYRPLMESNLDKKAVQVAGAPRTDWCSRHMRLRRGFVAEST
jgi:hypothetical protein